MGFDLAKEKAKIAADAAAKIERLEVEAEIRMALIGAGFDEPAFVYAHKDHASIRFDFDGGKWPLASALELVSDFAGAGHLIRGASASDGVSRSLRPPALLGKAYDKIDFDFELDLRQHCYGDPAPGNWRPRCRDNSILFWVVVNGRLMNIELRLSCIKHEQMVLFRQGDHGKAWKPAIASAKIVNYSSNAYACDVHYLFAGVDDAKGALL